MWVRLSSDMSYFLGMTSFRPSRIMLDFRPLAFLRACIVTPYRLLKLESESPRFTMCDVERALVAVFAVVFAVGLAVVLRGGGGVDEAVDFLVGEVAGRLAVMGLGWLDWETGMTRGRRSGGAVGSFRPSSLRSVLTRRP